MTALTSELAARAASLSFADLNSAARDWAGRAFADTVACAIAGAGDDVVRRFESILPASAGSSALLGRGGQMHELDAAQLNGIAAHALDFDDCNLEMDGHPSVSIVPALLALGDRIDCSGADLLTAYVAGVETEIRIARISNPAHADRGWHPTVTFGVIGAAVAVSRLLQLSPGKMAVAMGIAASCAAGLRANSGTMTKPLHAGQANRNGLQAALLAQAGFTATSSVLEHKFGFMTAFSGGVPADPTPALAGWSEDFALLSPGIAIKQYPCCAFIHCAIDAAVELHAQIGDTTILDIDVALHGRRLKNIDRPHPRDGLDAKFSTQYLTARALLTGTIGFADFENAALADPATQKLSAKVGLSTHDRQDLSFGRVKVALADGRTLSAEASVAMGRGPDNPMSPGQFKSKFMDCVHRVLPAERAETLFEAMTGIWEQPSVRQLTRLMQPGAVSSRSPDPVSFSAANSR